MQTQKWIEMEDPVVDLHISPPLRPPSKLSFYFFFSIKRINSRVKTKKSDNG